MSLSNLCLYSASPTTYHLFPSVIKKVTFLLLDCYFWIFFLFTLLTVETDKEKKKQPPFSFFMYRIKNKKI